MCGWTILWRWYKNFAMETCLQPMIYATPQHQEQLNRVILRSQQSWNRTNATRELCRFAMESRQAFMAEYARGQADTRLPPGVDTTMFVGPPKEYVQEVCLKQRSPTHRQRASPSELMGIGYVIRAEPTCPSVPVCSGVRIDADAYPCRFPWIPCFRGGVRVPDHSSSRPRANVRCSIQSPAPERPSTKSKR